MNIWKLLRIRNFMQFYWSKLLVPVTYETYASSFYSYHLWPFKDFRYRQMIFRLID